MKTPEELTEDWKAGKLESGWYYIKNEKWNCIFPDNYFAPVKSWRFSKNECIDKILAPVPDYEEFESLRKTANGVKYVSDKCWEKTKALEGNVTMFKSLFRQYLEREKEIESLRHYQTIQNEDIAKLRGLLKECLPIVSAEIMTWQIRGGEESHKRGQDLLTRINAALGESEE